MAQQQSTISPVDIRIMMLRRGDTTARLAKKLRVTQRAVNFAIKGHRSMHKLRARIVEYMK